MTEDLSIQPGQDVPAVPGWLFYLTLASVGLVVVALAMLAWQRSAVVMSLTGEFLKYCF